MNAGSYVISPASSAPDLTWRRSVARITPSLIGISYCLPVRLSVTVSVSAIVAEFLRFQVVGVVGLRHGLAAGSVGPVGPSRQIRIPAAFAAERPPALVNGMPAAQDAQARLAHPTNHN